MTQTRRHPSWIWAGVVLLALLHQDFWWWNSRTLVFGFLPIGLAYHAAFSLAAAGLWALACRWAWPDHIEEWANKTDAAPSSVSRPVEQEDRP
jgi:hypothetical protein